MIQLVFYYDFVTNRRKSEAGAQMIVSSNQKKNGKRLRNLRVCAFLIVCCLLLGGLIGAQAEGQTTLTIGLKGVSYVGRNWVSVPLSGRFDVETPDGRPLGRICANPSPEQTAAGEGNVITIANKMISTVVLRPVAEDFQAEYTCKDAIEVSLTVGGNEYYTASAYAAQGVFTVRNTIAETGEPAGGAEFMVLDAAGSVRMSFVTNEQGEYTATRALPNGEYRLMQMKAAEGSLLLEEPQSFGLQTYFGDPENITLIEIQNNPVPLSAGEARVTVLESTPFEKAEQDGDGNYYATVSLSAGPEKPNGLPLENFVVDMIPTAMVNSAGELLNIPSTLVVERVRATGAMAGVQISVQGVDMQGLPIGKEQTASMDEPVQLENAVGVKVTYVNAQTGEAIVPQGFEPGELTALVRYVPAASLPKAYSVKSAELTAQVSYSYEYPSADGNRRITTNAQSAPVKVQMEMPTGKAVITAAAVCDRMERTVAVSLSHDDIGLDGALYAVVELPENARADEVALKNVATLLRTQISDRVIFTLEQLREGEVVVPVKAGTVSSLKVYISDPCRQMKTLDNPNGASIEALVHSNDPLLSTLTAQVEAVYSQIPCTLEGSLSLGAAAPLDWRLLDGIMYEDVDQSGTRTQDEALAKNHGVLLRGEQSGIYYGSITDQRGKYTIYTSRDVLDWVGTLISMVPENALSTGSHRKGLIERGNLALPDTDYPISFSRMGLIQGEVVLDGRRPVGDADITLWQGSEQIAAMKTSVSGAYCFEELEPGEYRVKVQVPEEANALFLARAGVKIVNPTTMETDPFELSKGQEMQLSFAALSMGSIQGVVTQGEGEAVAKVKITLVSPVGRRAEIETDESGIFVFTDLVDGEYQLTVTLPETLAVIGVNGRQVSGANPYEIKTTVPLGGGIRQDIQVESMGFLAGNIPEAGEGQTITAASLTEQVTAVTDAAGNFLFTQLPAGDYSIYAPLVKDKNLPADSVWRVTQRGDMIWTSVTVKKGEAVYLPDIQYVEMTGIRGVAYVDQNGDYQYAEGEQLVSGITVALQRREGGGWKDVANTQTNEYGVYSFLDLPIGAYRVASMTTAEGMGVMAVGPGPIPVGSSGVMCSEELRLEEGMLIANRSDIALAASSALQFAAFFDSNENGVRGEYERPIAGVLVEVLGEDGETVLASGVSDAAGEGRITGLGLGERTLRVTMPAGYMITKKGSGQGLDVSCVEGNGTSSALSAPIVFRNGEVTKVAAGAIPVGSFSGRVWNDINNNGVMDADEPGMGGVELTLAGVKTKSSYSAVTDSTGQYEFPMLRNDQYNFSAVLPEGMLFAKYTLTGGDSRSVFTVAGTKATRQFPVTGAANVVNKNVGVIESGVVEGVAFLDFNYNGMMDDGEAGYKGVKVEVIRVTTGDSMGTVTTDENGNYRFASLRGGEYRVRAILPDDGSIFTRVPTESSEQSNRFAMREGRRENTLSSVTIGNGGKATIAIGVARGAQIKGTTFQDANYDGIMGGKEKKAAGIKVELRDESGAVVQSVTSSAKGTYTIDGIMPGNYTLHFLRRDKHAFTRLRSEQKDGNWVMGLEGAYGITAPIPVSMGESIAGVNAGILPSSTLKGAFFDDLNDNGLQDEGELGMANVIVRLYSQDAEIDLTTKVTPEGEYFFDGVMPGKYTLTYQLPTHTELAKVMKDGNTLEGQGQETITQPFDIKMGTANERPLVGAVTLGTFEGRFFYDSNANGMADAGEEAMAGAVVTLSPSRPELEATQATADADGRFSITGLRPADYQLEMKLPEGYIFSASLPEVKLTLETANSQKMGCTWEALTGRVQSEIGGVKPAVISGYVFLDENRNGNQESEETLMRGLSFELVSETAGTVGTVVKRATSGEDGYVTFGNVRPGSYSVQFSIPDQAEPAGEAAATMTAEAGKMIQRGITVNEAGSYDALRAGLVSRTSIGGTVALEAEGRRTPLEGIGIRLFQGNQETPVQTAKTNENGQYRFNGLWPEEYRIEADLPEGMIFVRPEDPNYAEGTSTIIAQGQGMGVSGTLALEMARHRTSENILYILPAKIGDLAWVDTNKNGLIDAQEPMLPGITVELVSEGQAVAQTQTDAFGYYLFSDVYPGTYTLRVTAYPELAITQSIAELRIISSCLTKGDGTGAESDPFAAYSGVTDTNYDLGFVLKDGAQMPAAVTQLPPQKDWTGAYGSKSP